MEDGKKNENFLGLGKGSRITVCIVAFLAFLFFIADASSSNEAKVLEYVLAAFCLLISGATLLPEKPRGYCGDVIAIGVIFAAGWFMWSSLPNPEPGENPIMFALLFGGMSISYLVNRYKNYFKNSS